MAKNSQIKKMIRLDKYLADMNVGTRKEVKSLIRSGQVSVCGIVAADPGAKIEKDSAVCVQGKPVEYNEYFYYMLNKPGGYVTAAEDALSPAVMSLLKDAEGKGLFPVGRLDKDTVGLLLITNNGPLAHRLLSPKYHVPKVYEAETAGPLAPEHVALFAAGLPVDEDWTAKAAKLEILFSGETSLARLTITEGKYHQVKRMFAAIGRPVLHLKRTGFGGLTLDPMLREGEYRPLSGEEVSGI